MDITDVEYLHRYYQNLGFEMLANTFNEIYQKFLDYDNEIAKLKEQLTEKENELQNAIKNCPPPQEIKGETTDEVQV